MSTIEQQGSLSGRVSPEAAISGNVSGSKTMTGRASVSAGTNDYEKLLNIPSIESVQLKGNKTFEDLGLAECSNLDIDNLFKSIFG